MHDYEYLLSDISTIKGIGNKTANLFRKKQINTIFDLLLKLPKDFNWQHYLSVNKDLQKDGVTDETAAIEHWLKFGHKEDREYCTKKDTFSHTKQI